MQNTVVQTLNVTDARSRFTELVDQATKTHLRTVVTKNGKPAVVIISVEDLEALENTIEVLSDPQTMAAIEEAKNPDAVWYSHEEILAIIESRRASA